MTITIFNARLRQTGALIVGARWLPTIAAIAAIALTVSLGNWQTRRAEEKLRLQQDRDRAAALAPLGLTPDRLAQPSALQGYRVIAQGRFLDQYSVFIDNRSYRGQAGFHLLTPMAVDGLAQPVLVLRGWVAQDPAQRSRLPRIASPAPPLRIEALVERDLDQVLELAKAPEPGPGDRLWQNASIAAVARWSGLSLAPLLLRQLGADEAVSLESATRLPSATDHADQRGASADALAVQPDARLGAVPSGAVVPVRDWVSPGLGVDKHRAYAFQWYSMAVLVAFLWCFFLWRSRRIDR